MRDEQIVVCRPRLSLSRVTCNVLGRDQGWYTVSVDSSHEFDRGVFRLEWFGDHQTVL